MDCPEQTVDTRFAQTMHGLSQAQHDQLNTYPKPLRLRCGIPNPKYESLTSLCSADRSPSLRLRPFPFVCGTWLCVVQSVDPVCTDSPWIFVQSVAPRFAQGNSRIGPIHGLRITYMLFLLCATLCMCIHGQSDRCWTAIVINFNAYWSALPTGGWHRLLAGRNCKVWDACNGWQCNVGTESWRGYMYRDGRNVTRVQGSVTGIQNKSVTGDMEKRVGTDV